MTSAWFVGIDLFTKSNYGNVANGIVRDSARIDAATATTKSRLASLGATAGRNLSLGFAAFGVVAGAAMLKGVKGAADLETAMVSIRNATGATTDQMELLRAKAFEVSAATAQSVVDSARVMKVMATSGINNPNQLLQIAKPAAMFADVQFLSRGVPFEEGAKQAIQLAHLYQAYTPKQVAPLFDELTKLSQMMPDNLNRYLTQASYYMPLFRRMGVDQSQSLVLGAWMDRMGLGRGKGGTGLQNFLLQQMQPLQMTSHMQKGRRDALSALGLMSPDGSATFLHNGQFNVIGALEQIDKAVGRRTAGLTGHARDVAMQGSIVDIQKALGVQGGRIGFLGTPEAIGQLHQMLEQLAKMPGLYEQQARYMNTLAGQFQLFKTNVSSLLTDLMWGSLVPLTGMFRELAREAHSLQQWVHAHRDEANLIVKGMLVAAAYGFTRLGLAMGRMMFALAGAPAGMDRLTYAIERLATVSAGSAGTIGVAGAEVGAAGVAARGGLFMAAAGLSRILGVLTLIPILLDGYVSLSKALGGPGWNPKVARKSKTNWRNFGDYPMQVIPPRDYPVSVTHEYHYHAPMGHPAEHKRAAMQYHRDLTRKVSENVNRAARTASVQVGLVMGSSRASSYEFSGSAA